jgi:ribosome biogenesis GTPase
VLIDTPGLRSVGLWDAGDGLARAFADVTRHAERCRFRDCTHHHEPGCAVLAALAAGELDAERVESYRKLVAEIDQVDRHRERWALAEDKRRTRGPRRSRG